MKRVKIIEMVFSPFNSEIEIKGTDENDTHVLFWLRPKFKWYHRIPWLRSRMLIKEYRRLADHVAVCFDLDMTLDIDYVPADVFVGLQTTHIEATK